jgi:hypothetical protein
VRHFKHARASDVVVARLDAIEYVAHLWAGPVELGIVCTEESDEVVWGKVPKGTAVCVLRAGLVLGEDGLAAGVLVEHFTIGQKQDNGKEAHGK